MMKVSPLQSAPHKEVIEREQWGRKAEFILSCIGYAVGLGNIWRFPYLCYKNGGASFLIPYIIMLLLCGIPLFYMELAIGQYLRKGAVEAWTTICPVAKGIGVAMLVISGFISIYYNVIIAWSLLYMWNSLATEVPFKTCGNWWNTPLCREIGRNSSGNCAALGLAANCTIKTTTPSEEYWSNYILRATDGITTAGEVRVDLAFALLVAWIIVFFCVSYGIRSSGKIAYFSATFPYVILAILLIRGATLPGALKGVIFYLNPDFSKLLDPQTWIDAASQIFFSLSVGLGGLIVFGSYNDFKNNCEKDAVVVSLINCCTSFFGGFATFTVLGFMAHTLGKDIKDVVSSGPGLAFVVYPESIAQMPISPLWAFLFFFMLFLLGIDSQFVFIETIMACLSDRFKFVRRNKKIALLGLCSACCLVGLCCVTEGGIYMFNIFDRQAAGFSLMFVSIIECLVIGWAYGIDHFSSNIEEMLNKKPNLYFRLCWKYISPSIVTIIFVWSFIQWTGLRYEDYQYPLSGELIGWGLALTSMAAIPFCAVHYLIKGKGSFKSRLKKAFTPIVSSHSDWTQQQDPEIPLQIIIDKPRLLLLESMSVSETVNTPQKCKLKVKDLPQKSHSTPSAWIRSLSLQESMV